MIAISPVYARYVLQEFQRREVNPAALFRGTALNGENLFRRDTITVGDFNRLLENGRTALGDERLGLVIARQANVMTLGPVGVAAASAPTLREGLKTIESFSRLHAAQVSVEIGSNLQGVAVAMRFVAELGEVGRFHAESGAMLLQSYAEMVVGEAICDAQYRMHFPRPEYAGEYAEDFHSPVSFGWRVSSVQLPRHWLDMPSPYYNVEQWQQSRLVLSQRLREQSAQRGEGYAAYVHSVLRASELPLPDLIGIATNLGVSARTLNRRLQAEGARFRDIRASVLAGWARLYLTETEDSVEAIGAALGYEDTSNFRRAFRGWEGCAPAQFRLRSADPPDKRVQR